jgi:hypothetical protein
MFSEQTNIEPRQCRSTVGLYELVRVFPSVPCVSFIRGLICAYSIYWLVFVETDDRNAVNSCVNV